MKRKMKNTITEETVLYGPIPKWNHTAWQKSFEDAKNQPYAGSVGIIKAVFKDKQIISVELVTASAEGFNNQNK
jgi:hypothetical protein